MTRRLNSVADLMIVNAYCGVLLALLVVALNPGTSTALGFLCAMLFFCCATSLVYRLGATRLFFAWAAVFALNMVVPLVFGWSLTEEHGRLGMLTAALLFLVAGCWVCASRRRLAGPFLAGATLVAATQLVPILQFLAGVAGMAAGDALGLADFGDDSRPPQLHSELGGFVVTIVTGAVVIVASAVAGFLIRLTTPRRWWRRFGAETDA